MTTILDEIVAHKADELERARCAVPEKLLESRLSAAPPVRPFRAALDVPDSIQLIAEIKRRSPSAGVLRLDFDPVALAEAYARHGASAISVLTDEQFFHGTLYDLRRIREAVPTPLLRKDFVLDRYQLLEGRLAGADAVLLIAEVLPGEHLPRLVQEAKALGLEPFVELHDAANFERVLDCGATLIGINNRDLRTFETRLEHTLELAPRTPAGYCLVSESGIRTREDVLRLQAAGVRAILVGEALMRSADVAGKLNELRGINAR